jgi:Lon protease-like protein
MTKLPEIIPIFPLHGTILLPNTILPLHVFEPRYRQMIEDIMEQDKVIGMLQPKDKENEEVYSVGCVGQVEQCQQLPNENYMIRLNGLIRFRVESELEVSTLYRQVEVDYLDYREDLEEENIQLEGAGKLLQSFQQYADKKNIQVEWEKLKTIPAPYLVNILCMNLDFNSMEKQALLESINLQVRWDNLCALLEMAVAGDIDLDSSNECLN